jgi:hypothetical protein
MTRTVLQRSCVIAALALAVGCNGAPRALPPSSTVMAETTTGAVPMLPLGQLRQTGDGLTITFRLGRNEAGWADLLKASRIFGIVVKLPELEFPGFSGDPVEAVYEPLRTARG